MSFELDEGKEIQYIIPCLEILCTRAPQDALTVSATDAASEPTSVIVSFPGTWFCQYKNSQNPSLHKSKKKTHGPGLGRGLFD
jgi:hypothetical protein